MIAPTAKNPSTDESERPGLENSDGRTGNYQKDKKKLEGPAHREQIRIEGEQDEPQNDCFLPAKFIREISKENACERDPGHGGVVKSARDRHTEKKLFDDFGNNDADGIRRHCEHHEHEKREPFDYGQAALMLSCGFHCTSPERAVPTDDSQVPVPGFRAGSVVEYEIEARRSAKSTSSFAQ
jgi:hypothetical protein